MGQRKTTETTQKWEGEVVRLEREVREGLKKTHMEFSAKTVEEFLRDTALPESARGWARSLLGA